MPKTAKANTKILSDAEECPLSSVLTSSFCACLVTEDQLDAELEKGYEDMLAGRTKSAKSVFADIRREYGL